MTFLMSSFHGNYDSSSGTSNLMIVLTFAKPFVNK